MHIVRSTSLKYSKVRQFQEHFQFDVCRHEVRYGCLREDSCHFAHSFIELKVWLLQQYSGEGEGLHSSEEGGAGLWGCRGASASWTSQDTQGRDRERGQGERQTREREEERYAKMVRRQTGS